MAEDTGNDSNGRKSQKNATPDDPDDYPPLAKKAQLAKILGISRPTLDKHLLETDSPQPNIRREWNVEEVANFIAQKKIEKSKSGVSYWDAEKKRLECQRISEGLARDRGEFISKKEASSTLVPLMAELGSLLRKKFELELPSRYQGRDRVECAQINASAIDDIISRFRKGAKDLIVDEPR